MKTSYITVLFALLALSSCKKDEEETEPTPTPQPTVTIDIEEPTDTQMFSLNETVHIHVNIEANFDLHGYEAFIINESTTDTVWSTDAHDHAESFHIEGEWINNVVGHSDMLLKVIVEKDHDGNTVAAERHFHCHPM